MESLEKNETNMYALQNYEAPVIEIVEVRVEKGFADYTDDSPETGGNGTDPEANE
jgi:hypothetical protein